MIIIPGLILIIISLLSITKQKTFRIIDLKKEISLKADTIVESIEEDIEKSFNKTIEEDIEKSFNKTLDEIKNINNFEGFNSEKYINFFKDIILHNSQITYPFVVDNNGKYVFPIEKKTNANQVFLKNVSKLTDLEIFLKSNKLIKKDYTEGEKSEFGDKKYLLAIKSYLKVLNKISKPILQIEILYAISRCYSKNGNFSQAITYLEEINVVFDTKLVGHHYLKFKILYDMANYYDKIGQKLKSAKIFIDLYDKILKYEKLTKRYDYSFLKKGILQYLEKNLKNNKIEKQTYEKIKKDDGLSDLSDIELELNWSFSSFENVLLNKSNDIDLNNAERYRLRRIKEFYLNSDEKTIYYQKLLNYSFWKNNQKEPYGINSRIIKDSKKSIYIIYSKIFMKNKNKFVYYGYKISMSKIKSHLLDLNKKYFKNKDFKIEIKSNVSDINLGKHIAFSDFKKYFQDLKLYIYSNEENYINKTIKNELLLNYFIVLFLFLMLIIGIVFFLRVFNKEKKILKMKSDFVDSVSHTLKTPLTRIRLIIEKLELGWTKDPRTKEEGLKIIQTETELMSESIENMLSFSRIDSGKLKYKKNSLDMSVYLTELIENYSSYLKAKGFSIDVIIENTPIISFDREAFKLIFINLMQNSIKYSLENKNITIELKYIDNEVVFILSDRGIGISLKFLKSVFDRFVRSDNNLVKSIEGSGLGLFLVKHAVDAHKGNIIIKNRDGGGIEVKIVFANFIEVKND